jgi:hypothetical protein
MGGAIFSSLYGRGAEAADFTDAGETCLERCRTGPLMLVAEAVANSWVWSKPWHE